MPKVDQTETENYIYLLHGLYMQEHEGQRRARTDSCGVNCTVVQLSLLSLSDKVLDLLSDSTNSFCKKVKKGRNVVTRGCTKDENF